MNKMVDGWLLLAYISLAVAVPLIYDIRYDGDKCKLADGISNGVCRPALSCAYLKAVPKKEWMTCSFERDNPIVCCPELPTAGLGNSKVRLSSASDSSCDSFPLVSDINDHIFGGNEAAVNEFPHLAALGYPTKEINIPFRCGASLISHRFLLTAAHCFYPEKPTFARLGVVNLHENNPADSPVDVGFKQIIIHPNYSTRPLKNDIALVELNRTITEKFIHPACLYTNTTDPPTDMILSIEGWGSTDPNDISQSPILLKANVTTLPRDSCNSTLAKNKSQRSPTELQDGQLCALGRNAQNETFGDTCVGDSGGPLEFVANRRRYIVGITSSGKLCGSFWPGIYTKVSQYVDWIESIVWPNSTDSTA